eukprot:SAG31_NODE_2908_length_4922_cov_5.967655_2_plen_45_part_00
MLQQPGPSAAEWAQRRRPIDEHGACANGQHGQLSDRIKVPKAPI